MKTKLLRLLSVVGLILAALASLDMTGFTSILPAESAGKALAAGLMAAALKDFVFAVGDLADDGKRNNSWSPAIAWILVPLCLLMLPSCVTTKMTTTAPDGTVTVTEYRGPDAASVTAAAGAAGVVGKIIAEK